jgi:hypothetical protein
MTDFHQNTSDKKSREHLNYDRRSGIDQRQFSYDENIPERRAEEERRTGMDRRNN